MDPILCKKHNIAKVPMRNKRNAPMLGCPICHAPEVKSTPEPAPVEKKLPTPGPRRCFSLLGLAKGS